MRRRSQSAQWQQLHEADLIGERFSVLELDAHSCSKEDITVVNATFSCAITHPCAMLNAFAGWFDVQFCGSTADPAPNPVELTTAPSHSTHWAQQLFYVHPPFEVQAGDVLKGSVLLTRQKVNHRLLAMQVKMIIVRGGVTIGERSLKYKID